MTMDEKKGAYRKKKRVHLTGTRLGAHALVAQALSAQGLSSRSVAKITGISATSVLRLARKNLLAPEHAERIRSAIRDQFAMVAGAALSKITDDKLEDSSASELTRIAALAGEHAGLTTPSPVEYYHAITEKYVLRDPIGPDASQISED
jgi:hypothetical protein